MRIRINVASVTKRILYIRFKQQMVLNIKHRGYLFGEKSVSLNPQKGSIFRASCVSSHSRILTNPKKHRNLKNAENRGHHLHEPLADWAFKII